MRRFYRIVLCLGAAGLFLLSIALLGTWRSVSTLHAFAEGGTRLANEVEGSHLAQGRLRVSVYGLSVTGTLAPASAPYTFVLYDSYGTVKAEVTGTLGTSGQFSVQLTTRDRRGVPILPGDYLLVLPEGGEPVTVSVPAMTARPDVASRTVIGTAPPGSGLEVAITPRHGCDIDRGGGIPGGPPGDTRPIATVPATADAGGRFSATFPGEGPWERGTSGQVTYISPEGHEFVASWASIRLRMTSQQQFLDLIVPPGRVISVTTFSPNGRPAATGLESIGAKVGNWSCWTVAQLTPSRELGPLQNRDIALPQPGDTIRLDVGEDTFTVRVPDLVGMIDVAANQVLGHARPGADVTLQALRPGGGGGGPMGGRATPIGQPVAVKVGASGRFSHTFGGNLQLLGTDQVSLETWIDGSRYTHYAVGSPLTVNLNGRTVAGTTAPFAGVYAAVRRGGELLLQTTSRADGDGDFVIGLVGSGAAAFSFQTGDLLTVQAASGAGVLNFVLTMPVLELALDAAKGEVSGRASGGGRLEITSQMLPNVSPGGNINNRPVTPDANGEFRTMLPLPPGRRVDAIYRLAGDHRVQLTRVVPVAHVQHAGGQVCGWSDTGDAVKVTLADAKGKVLTSGEAVAGGASTLPIRDDARIAFVAHLVDDEGAAIATKAGQRVEVTIGSRVITATVPELYPDLDWSTAPGAGRIEGSFAGAEDGSTVFAAGPSTNCFGLDDGTPPRDSSPGGGNSANPLFYTPMAAPGGVFAGTFRYGVPGSGFIVAIASPGGVRFVKPFVRPLSQALVNSSRVQGWATPHEQIEAQLLDANLTPRAWASEVVTRDNGFFELTLRSITGTEVTLLDGDVAEVASARRLEQSPLRSIILTATEEGDFIGLAPAGQPVTMRVRLRDGRQAPVRTYADLAGAFRFGAANAPGRVDWRFEDVLSATAVLGTDSQHEVIDEAILPSLPYVPLPPPVYLPSTRR